MNKKQVLEKIQEEKKHLDNWQGGTETTLGIAKEILKIAENTVTATEDSPIYHNTFGHIGRDISGTIRNNRGNTNSFSNQANNLLVQLTPLSLSHSVNSLRAANAKQKKLIVELKDTIEQGKLAISDLDEVARIQRGQHEKEMIQISKSHNEQLEFEVPLRTWIKASEGYNKKGVAFLRLLIGLTVFSCLALVVLLLQTPDTVLLMFSGADKSAAIRWSFTFFILIGFLAYTLRAVVRAMFSSFHLARDADERALLTKYYLGLIRKGALEPNDRAIIMQSLFSRSDTGLLKDDGSPTMAGDLIAKMKVS
jgi:hypothetical protein